jgi:hypothetical protein
VAIKSLLNPSASVGVGVGILAVDFLIFDRMVPGVADIRTARPKNPDIETVRRQATIYCAGINGLISLITRDWNVFLIGGMGTIAMSYLIAHANEVNPDTGKMTGPTENSLTPDMSQWAMPDYSMQQEAAQ